MSQVETTALMPEMQRLRTGYSLFPERPLFQLDEDVGTTHITVEFGDLVFQNEMVPKGIPCKFTDQPMILMRVSIPMREDEVGVDSYLSIPQRSPSPCRRRTADSRLEIL